MSIAFPFNTPASDFSGIEPARLVMRPLFKLDEEQFAQLVAQNPDQPLEQNAQGEVQVMAPTGSGSSHRNNKILYQLTAWNESHLRGEVFESSTLFRFANGAARSPDASWVEKSRWERLTEEEQESIAPVCPNFVIELRSKTDRLVDLQEKLVEYLANGVELGWIVDPLQCRVHIYTAGEPVQILDRPATVAGTGCMTGFVLELKGIFPAAE
jgi:Uma2 family endonuclease